MHEKIYNYNLNHIALCVIIGDSVDFLRILPSNKYKITNRKYELIDNFKISEIFLDHHKNHGQHLFANRNMLNQNLNSLKNLILT